MNMTALSFYNVSNQFTFGHNFGIDMASPAAVERRAREVADILAGLGHSAQPDSGNQ